MRSLKVNLTDESHAAIQSWCVENGTTAGAMLEAFAERLLAGQFPAGEAGLNLVTRAREIAAERRRRD